MERDTYLLPPTYVYNVQVHRSVKFCYVSLELTRNPTGAPVVEQKLVKLASEDNTASPTYARLEIMSCAAYNGKKLMKT